MDNFQREEKLEGHRRAEHGGVLVLCGRAGNNACKKLLGVCANSPAFF